jgi:uncharacterized protein
LWSNLQVMYTRNQVLKGAEGDSLFLWGARQTGKSTLLQSLYPNALHFDLLDTDWVLRFQKRPAELREIILAADEKVVIIDEIQKVPELLDEIHWLIEKTDKQYIMSGSSPRKIIHKGINLLGGRALRYELYPLSYSEIPEFNLLQALTRGLMPKHYDSVRYEKLLSAYLGAYLEEEIIAETKIRDMRVFNGFLEKAAICNGEAIVYQNIASDLGVSGPTVKEYFNILQETMLGKYVMPFQKKPKRRVVLSPRFYFFDTGITNVLLKRKKIEFGTVEFGHSFEHFIYLELQKYAHYSDKAFEISYWRTSSGFEVDFVLGNHEVAIEVKGTSEVLPKHAKGLWAFNEEYKVRKNIIVSLDKMPRQMNDVLVLPWTIFLDRLWGGEVI